MGVETTITHSFEANQKGINYRAITAVEFGMLAQHDFENLFLEAVLGFLQYVDKASATDPLNGKMITSVQLGLGHRFSERMFARIRAGYVFPIGADYTYLGYKYRIEAIGGPTLALTIGVTF